MIDKTFGENEEMEEISLDAGPDADEPSDTPKQINHEYVQKTIRGITNHLTLFDDIYLSYNNEVCNPVAFKLKFFKTRDIKQPHINLTYLDPNPERKVHIAWNWFVNGLAAIAWAFVIIYIAEYTDFFDARKIMLPTGVLLGTFGILAFMVFFYKTQDKVVYKSFTGQVPVFELFHSPRKKEYNDFVDKLESTIYDAQRRKGLTMKYRLVGELKHLRKMKDDGLIAESVYEDARNKIFKHKEYQV